MINSTKKCQFTSIIRKEDQALNKYGVALNNLINYLPKQILSTRSSTRERPKHMQNFIFDGIQNDRFSHHNTQSNVQDIYPISTKDKSQTEQQSLVIVSNQDQEYVHTQLFDLMSPTSIERRKFKKFKNFYQVVKQNPQEQTNAMPLHLRNTRSPVQQKVELSIKQLVNVRSKEVQAVRTQPHNIRGRQFSLELQGKYCQTHLSKNKIPNKMLFQQPTLMGSRQIRHLYNNLDEKEPQDWLDFAFDNINSYTIEHVMLQKHQRDNNMRYRIVK